MKEKQLYVWYGLFDIHFSCEQGFDFASADCPPYSSPQVRYNSIEIL